MEERAKRNKGKYVIVWLLLIAALAVYTSYSLFFSEDSVVEKNKRKSEISEMDDSHKPAAFNEAPAKDEYKSVGGFIAHYHDWYNETLGWGRIEKLKWQDQQKTAEVILHMLENIQTDNDRLNKDLKAIQSYASRIAAQEKNEDALIKLHRYFHDLDIEYNGYKGTKDYFNITEYKNNDS